MSEFLFIGGKHHNTYHEVRETWNRNEGFVPSMIWRLWIENPINNARAFYVQYERQTLRNQTNFRNWPYYFYLAPDYDLMKAVHFLKKKGII
jgi:hypothetical protein